MEESICKWCDWQGINLEIVQTALAVQYLKNKQTNQEMGRRSKQTFIQRRHTDGQEAHEKMLNITNSREMQIKTAKR